MGSAEAAAGGRRPAGSLAALALAASLATLAAGPAALAALAPAACSFRARTGVPCLGCGGTHALASMARGDLRSAWAENALGAWAGLGAWLLALASGLGLLTGSRRWTAGALAGLALLTPVVFAAWAVSWWFRLPPGALH